MELPKTDTSTNTVVLYWLETDPCTVTISARYGIIPTTGAGLTINDLSTAWIFGRRTWTSPNGVWTGDYFKGAFYYDGKRLGFFTQWVEEGPPLSRNVHFAIVSY